MISAEHSDNNGKYKVTKNPHDIIIWIKARRTYGELSSQADLATEN